jgi:hypothetical protein
MRVIAAPTTFMMMAVALTACRSKDQNAAPPDSTAVAPSAAATPAVPNVVVVHAKNYAFDAPDQVPAGMTTFRLLNDGPGIHHMEIVRIDSGKTLGDLQKALQQPGPPPAWAVFVGGPNAPAPKSEANATLDLTPGQYALLCFVDVPEGVPHFAKGMSRALTVTPSTSAPAAAPTPDVTVTLSDYKFDLSGPIASGKQTFVVRTGAGQPHELELIQLASGKTAKDMLDWIGNNMKGPPPGRPIGGAAPAVPGTAVYFTADLTPGKYMLVCFLPDKGDAKPHFVHGMVKTVNVT